MRLSMAVVALVLAHAAPGQTGMPNIVVVPADGLGRGDPQSCQPESKIPTPNIDRLAHEGMRFTDAHSSSSVCTPTRYGLLTGRYSWRISLKSGVLDGFGPPLIEPGEDTMASLLRRSGSRTAVVGKWHLGMRWLDKGGWAVQRRSGGFRSGDDVDYTIELRGGPLDVGFETCFGVSASLDMSPYCFLRNRSVETHPEIPVPSPHADIFSGLASGLRSQDFQVEEVLPRLAEEGARIIDLHVGRDHPVFLYLALASPHLRIAPVGGAMSRAGRYGDFVSETDRALGQALEAPDRTGRTERTLVVLTSDNGGLWHWWDFRASDDGGAAPLTARGRYVRDRGHRSNAGWRGTKADIFEGGHRIPLVVRSPGEVAAGTTSEALEVLTDLYATVARISGDRPRASSGQDSIPLLPVLRGHSRSERTTTVHHSARGMFAIWKANWELIGGRGSGGFTVPRSIEEPGGQLNDLAEDPQETRNLHARRSEIAAELQDLLRATLK